MKADQVSQYTGTHCSEMTGMQAKLQRPICGGGGGDRGEIIPMPSAAFPILRGYACIRVCVCWTAAHMGQRTSLPPSLSLPVMIRLFPATSIGSV